MLLDELFLIYFLRFSTSSSILCVCVCVDIVNNYNKNKRLDSTSDILNVCNEKSKDYYYNELK